MPLFSVIVPSFNRAALLGATMSSIFAQACDDYETIVVDDGSTDGTMDYLKTLGGRVQVLEQPNKGPGAARNLGAGHARGRYLAFLDSDDVWLPWTLDVYRRLIEDLSAPAFIAGKPFVFHDADELKAVAEVGVESEQFPDYLGSGDRWRWWGVSSFVIRRDVFAAAGGFMETPRNGEDADLALKLGVAPGFVQVTAPVTFGYREHSTNVRKDMTHTLAGTWAAVHAEKTGRYPGGRERVRERWRILTRQIRPVAISCLQNSLRRDAWGLYAATFGWNALIGKIKFLAAFPLLAIVSELRGGAKAK